MRKTYSYEFKVKVVKEYLDGPLGYSKVAKKNGMLSHTPIIRWVNAYQTLGLKGLRKQPPVKNYPVHFKLDVLNFIHQTGASYQETANHFKMTNPNMIGYWLKIFRKDGVEGLSRKSGGALMSKKETKKSFQAKKNLSREQQLEKENELLRLEIAYLKKFKAFQKNPNAFLEKHKQQWHTNSNKKDSN